MRTWLAGDLAGAGLGDAGYVRLVFSGGICVAPFTLHLLNMLALGDRMAQGAGRLCTPHANIYPACDRGCSWRSRIDCWPHWFCRPVGTADCPASGISGSARSAPSFQLVSAHFLVLLADIIARTLFTPHELATGVADGVSWCARFCHYGDGMFR